MIYIKNKSGLKTEPCGIPYKIKARFDSLPLIETYCFMLDKSDLNQSFARLWIPQCSSLANKISYSTVSKAFCKSTKIPQPIFQSTRFFPMSSVRLITACAVEYFCQKPNCKGVTLSLKSLKILLYINFSHIFSRLDKSEIGR